MNETTVVLQKRRPLDAVDLGGDVLIYDCLHLRRLPDTGALIWKLVDGYRTAADIAALVADGRPVSDVPTVTADVVSFLGDLLDHRVLELAMLDRTAFGQPVHVGFNRRGSKDSQLK